MKNQIYYSDNLDVLRNLPDDSIDLCYIDPPFHSKRNYNQVYNNIGQENKIQVQAFVDTWMWDDDATQGLSEIQRNYNKIFTSQCIDLIDGLINVLKKGSLLAYLVSMTLRIVEIQRVLKPTGSFYLHCDPTASHYLKLILDAIFCARGGEFRDEIVWCYRKWNVKQAQFPHSHDIILFYSKSDKHVFNTLYIPKSAKSASGKKIQSVIGEDGKRKSIYLDEFSEGTPIPDWWEIPIINPMAKERLGYPTQKPEALLARIIKASSNENDVILDAYCGCGTTVVVAEKLKRQWIGIDITYQSISLILKRLEDQQPGALNNIEIKGVPNDFDGAVALANKIDRRTHKEFEKWIILSYSRNQAIIQDNQGSDTRIGGIAYIPDRNAKGDIDNYKILFYVESSVQSSLAIIHELNDCIERENAVCGVLLTLYPMPNLVKDGKQYGSYYNKLVARDYPKIQVVSVMEIFDGKFLELPNVVKVLKDAEQHIEQSHLNFD